MWLSDIDNGSGHNEIILSTNNETIPAYTWVKAYVTFKTPDYQNTYYMKPFICGIGENVVCVTKVKVEEGNKATDWTPAPEDINNAIDNIQVGGRNLFKGYNEDEIVLHDYQNAGSFTQFFNLTFDPAEYLDQEFTISFYAKSPNGSTNLLCYNHNSSPRYFYFYEILDDNLSTEWKYYSFTFKNIDRGASLSENHKVEIYAPQQMGVRVKKIKVELGNKATDWSPCPDDITAAINTKVNDTQEAIFNRLFANGQQGFTLENNRVYINGEVIKANTISGETIKAGTLDAGKITVGQLQSSNGKSTFNLNNGAMLLGSTNENNYLEWTGSSLNIRANSIRIGSGSVATTGDLNNAIDNIKINRNLVKNAPILNNSCYYLNAFRHIKTIYDDNSAKSGKVIKIECTQQGEGFYCDVWQGDDSCIGRTYTWSFYAKMNQPKTITTVGHERGGLKSISVTTE